MKIVIACDSFKDALSAEEVCKAIARGIRQEDELAEIVLFPLADGGEGTAGILTRHAGGEMLSVQVNDPLFRTVSAEYGWVAREKLAFIDMAQASGLPLLEASERDPLRTTTFGTGELLNAAIQGGARRIVLGIGGSATNDCGIGMAAAMGYNFWDAEGKKLEPVGANLGSIARIDDSRVRFDPEKVKVEVITDVDNPLCGHQGATRVYAAQKGADVDSVEVLEKGMSKFARVLEDHFDKKLTTIPGSGAAGGLGAGALAFLSASMRAGTEAVLEYTRFEDGLSGADLVLTGEGRLDGQTLHGKLIFGIAQRSKSNEIPVVALCGSLDAQTTTIRELGLAAAFSILPGPMSLAEALKRTPELLTRCAAEVFRLWKH